MATSPEPSTGTGGASRTGSSDGGHRVGRPERRLAGRLCVFDVAAGRFGLDVTLVGEVVPVERAIVVPRSPRAVLGLFNLRGSAVALLDLATLLAMPAPARTGSGPPLALVLRRDATILAALRVDAVVTVLATTGATVRTTDRQVDHPAITSFVSTPATGAVSVLDPVLVQERVSTLRPR